MRGPCGNDFLQQQGGKHWREYVCSQKKSFSSKIEQSTAKIRFEKRLAGMHNRPCLYSKENTA